MNTNNKLLLEWQAPARPDHERNQRWYLVTGLACAVFVAYGLITGAWSMSITFAMIAGLYFLVRNEKHPLHLIRIHDIGIEFDGIFHSWAEWQHFWILHAENYFELHIAPAKGSRQELIIQTGETDPYRVRDALSHYLPQITHQKERLLDAFIRFCKL